MDKKFFLITGPSGSGKDTLIKIARQSLEHNENFLFIKRYITRKPDTNEENYYLSKSAFKILEKNNFFFTTWSIYNNFYGISLEDISEKSKNIIISVSRDKIGEFEEKFSNVTTIYITSTLAKIETRLQTRAREDKELIKDRLSRFDIIPNAKNLKTIFNDELISSSEELIKILNS